MTITPDMLPDDIDVLKTALITEHDERITAQALAASAQAKLSEHQALIAHLTLQIEKCENAPNNDPGLFNVQPFDVLAFSRHGQGS